MNHMNLFNNSDDLKLDHEDVLTRSFLILLDTIPLYKFKFFELINSKMEGKEGYKKLLLDDVEDTEIKTQVVYNDKWLTSFTNLDVVSILISNEKYETNQSVDKDDYKHRYDGVLKTANTIFIIENKPNVNNVWREQLNLNIKNNNILKDVCSIKWMDIVSFSNQLLQSNIITTLEHRLIDNFIEYIDYTYPELNPYDNFSLCKNEYVLLNKRCCKILEGLIDGVEVTHHKGWKDKINSGNKIIPEIALSVNVNDDNEYVVLEMVAGDYMSGAKTMYEKINLNRLEELLKNNNVNVYSCFHIAAYQKNIFYSSGDIKLLDYIKFWQKEVENNELKQISRENDKSAFERYYDKLVKNQIVKQSDFGEFERVFINSNYPVMNICPCIIFEYYWNKENAFELDKNGKFIEEVKSKMNMILNVFS